MEFRWEQPQDYRRALKRKLSKCDLEEYLEKSTPIFVFGPLMLPSVLKSIKNNKADFDQVSKMTQATLSGFGLYTLEGSNLPLIKPSSTMGQSVEGFVVFCLTAEQLDSIQDFEADQEVKLRNVQVEVTLSDGELRTIDAGAFIWEGELPDGTVEAETRSWKIDEFVQGHWYTTLKSGYDSY